ncbi:unnamed protein product [Phyllotreta striolata]|uniref:T-box domain-containing protein n=1 Tax=Phyllotreta striolata TaxID=444603 RepID=A0A9N9TUC5_PHYSR|nr:unnamed protein product [Phyllotreta striolata]
MVKYLSSMLNLGVNHPYYKSYEASSSSFECNVTLKNKELWQKFHSFGTEMIITKSGRRMFPSLNIQIEDLSPNALYCVFLEMAPVSPNRYRYSSSGQWFPAGTEELQSPNRTYLHPDSPARGDYWMSQLVSFGRLKLTNTVAPPAGQVVLSSMHKYQPMIIIAQISDPRELYWSRCCIKSFEETQFIAVTAYQNAKVTKLKIDNNPFAKGFRETGQAKCKRKRIEKEKIDNEELVCIKEEEPCAKSARLESPASDVSAGNDVSKDIKIFQSPAMDTHETSRYYDQSRPYYYYPYMYSLPTYSTHLWSNYYPQIPYIPKKPSPTTKDVPDKPRKLTDFSIKAITGCQ